MFSGKGLHLGIILLLFIVLPMEGQYFQGGFTAGITGSQVDGDYMEGYNKFGFSGGIFVRRGLGDNFGFQADFKYIMKGAAKRTSQNDREVFKLTLHYVEIPFVFTLQTSEKFEFELGPGVGYLAFATNDFGYGPEKLAYNIQNFDYTANLGVSYLFVEKLKFNIRFCYSLKAISRQPGNITILGKYGQYNHLIDLSAYYTLK